MYSRVYSERRCVERFRASRTSFKRSLSTFLVRIDYCVFLQRFSLRVCFLMICRLQWNHRRERRHSTLSYFFDVFGVRFAGRKCFDSAESAIHPSRDVSFLRRARQKICESVVGSVPNTHYPVSLRNLFFLPRLKTTKFLTKEYVRKAYRCIVDNCANWNTKQRIFRWISFVRSCSRNSGLHVLSRESSIC